MPPKKSESKLLKLANVDDDVKAPKKSLADLGKDLNRNANFKQHNTITLASETRLPQVIPTGFLALDYALGIGGFPCGRVVQLYGNESSYKSTICLRTIAEVQKLGGSAVWIDAEHNFNKNWAAINGVDNTRCYVADVDVLEDALDIVDLAAREYDANIIVLDSLAALPPLLEKYTDASRRELKPRNEEARMALAASVWTKWSRTGLQYIARNGILFLIVNQLRSSLSPYGNPTSVPGGRAVKHMNSISVNMARSTAKEDQVLDSVTKEPIGAVYKFKLDKTRFGPIGIEGRITVANTIVDNVTALRDIACRQEIIKPLAGSYWEVNGEKINGKSAVLAYLYNNKEVREDIERQVRAKMGFQIPENIKEAEVSVQADVTEAELAAIENDAEEVVSGE